MAAANSQPAHDITDATGHPNHPKSGPLSSYTVAAMAQPSTPRRRTRPSTYTPVPAITKVVSTCTVKARRKGTRYPNRAGTLKVADCQLKAKGMPKAL